MLPTVAADGEEKVFRVHEQGVKVGTSFLQLTVVVHPGWEIDHPLEAAGRSLWPRQHGDSVNFATTPGFHP